jgi:uncharacterized protein (DUF362 family)
MAKSKVVLVSSKSLYSNGRPDSARLGAMLSRGISLLHDGADADEIWKKLARDTGRLGLKPNCIAGRNMSTAFELTTALVRHLASAGKDENDIVIWEMSSRKLESAGYKLNVGHSGLKCYGTDTRDVGYGTIFHSKGKVASLVTRIVESHCDHLINLPILKDHSLAGVAGAMKNYYGVVHNPNKYHDNNCDPYVAEISALPVLKNKNVLTIMDLTRMQYQGGPGYRGEYAVRHGAIMMSTDPVAIDSVGERIINDYRTHNNLPTLADSDRPPKWLRTAEKLGLGVADLNNIDLIEVAID